MMYLYCVKESSLEDLSIEEPYLILDCTYYNKYLHNYIIKVTPKNKIQLLQLNGGQLIKQHKKWRKITYFYEE